MLQPNEPVIQALRQDIIEIRTLVVNLRKDLDLMNSSIQDAFQGMATGTGTSLRFLDARIDDLEVLVASMSQDKD